MQNLFKITKHINEWESRHNLYNRINGELTAEAINWYKSRAIAEIWADCISAWNKDHLRSCKSVTILETCFLERGTTDIKREHFGCLIITMPNLRYKLQVFNESITTGQIWGTKEEEKHFLKMNAKDIVDFVIEFDSYVPDIVEMTDRAILKVQQDRYSDQILEVTLPSVMDSLTTNTALRYDIINIKRGIVNLAIFPIGNYKFHMKISLSFEDVRDKIGIIIPAFETIIKQVDNNQTKLEIFSYSYPYKQ